MSDQRSVVDDDLMVGAFPAGWRNEATPRQQPPKRPSAFLSLENYMVTITPAAGDAQRD